MTLDFRFLNYVQFNRFLIGQNNVYYSSDIFFVAFERSLLSDKVLVKRDFFTEINFQIFSNICLRPYE